MNPGIKLSYSFERHVNYFTECSVCFVDVSIHESQLRNISPNRLFCHLVLLINSQSSDLKSITVVCNVSTKDIDFVYVSSSSTSWVTFQSNVIKVANSCRSKKL